MKPSNIKLIITIYLTAFILNAIWELSHYQLYYDLSGIPKYPHLLLATFTDALIITIIFLIISIKNKNLSWIKKPKITDCVLSVIFSLAIAISIEVRALSIGRWAYKEAMPTILGIGLSPLAQLAVTSIITILILKHQK